VRNTNHGLDERADRSHWVVRKHVSDQVEVGFG
jgi:hypothetical protein